MRNSKPLSENSNLKVSLASLISEYQPQASQSFPPAEPIQEINGFQVIDDLSYNTITSQIKDKIKLVNLGLTPLDR